MKFAYLIMVHDNPHQVELLLSLLDWPENDIFLHIDKKGEYFSISDLLKKIKKAKLHIYMKYNIYWGDISQTKCQFFLLHEATKTYHDYYHLISGSDLPIKSHKFILNFFEKNSGSEFVHFEADNYCKKEGGIYYHFLQPIILRTKQERVKKILCYVEKKLIKFQKLLGVNRKLYAGANWFSITHTLAIDLLANKRRILRKIRYMISSDEYVLQTFIKMISSNKYNFYCTENNNYKSIARMIDWGRGKPYVWKQCDYEELSQCEYLFARKFDEKIDSQIIDNIIFKLRIEDDT